MKRETFFKFLKGVLLAIVVILIIDLIGASIFYYITGRPVVSLLIIFLLLEGGAIIAIAPILSMTNQKKMPIGSKKEKVGLKSSKKDAVKKRKKTQSQIRFRTKIFVIGLMLVIAALFIDIIFHVLVF